MRQLDIPDIKEAFTEGLRALGEKESNRNWDPTAVHASDLAVALTTEEGGKCARQLWLRVNGVEGKPPSPGQELMWDSGKRLEKRVQESLVAGFMLQGGDWKVTGTNLDVSDAMPGEDSGELDIRLEGPNGEVVIVDVKSIRGNAFKYVLPRESNKIQLQAYMQAENADLGILFYIDREGQNHVEVCWVERDDKRVDDARQVARLVTQSPSMPGVLKPGVTIRQNKGPDAVYVDNPWQCQYCKYLDHGCPGALAPDMRELGLVAHVTNDGEIRPAVVVAKGDLPPDDLERNNAVLRAVKLAEPAIARHVEEMYG